MNKSERKQVDRALACLHSDARLAAASLATLQRSATSNKSQSEITAVIERHPGIRVLLSIEDGCYVPRVAA